MRFAVFASGNGSNFQAIAEATIQGEIPGELAVLFCDKKNAYAIERAKKLQIPAIAFSPQDFATKATYEAEILHLMEEEHVELIVLAGYMRIIGPTLLEGYKQRILNIHPALLPNFPGLTGIRDAFESGVHETGVTVHYVDAGVDSGPIIKQEKVLRHSEDTLASLEQKIHQVEHRIYPEVIAEVLQNIQSKEERKKV